MAIESKVDYTEMHGANPRHTWEGANTMYTDMIREMMSIMIDGYIPIEMEVKIKYIKDNPTRTVMRDPRNPENYYEEIISDS